MTTAMSTWQHGPGIWDWRLVNNFGRIVARVRRHVCDSETDAFVDDQCIGTFISLEVAKSAAELQANKENK